LLRPSSLSFQNPSWWRYRCPEPIHKILDFFDIGPDQAVYVGDSLIDLETAAAAGVYFIAYRNENLESLSRAGSMEEIDNIFADIENQSTI